MQQDDSIVLGLEKGNVVLKVEYFGYFSSIANDKSGSVERAVRATVAAAWTKWRDIWDLQRYRTIPLRIGAVFFVSCICSLGDALWCRVMATLHSLLLG